VKISWEDHGSVALVIASGECTGDGADTMRRSVSERLAHGAKSIILDFANVTLADSAALECLLWIGDETVRLGGALRVVAPQHAVREALRLTRLEPQFVYADTVELAARSLRS
jgi:anti-anti-sigma factor